VQTVCRRRMFGMFCFCEMKAIRNRGISQETLSAYTIQRGKEDSEVKIVKGMCKKGFAGWPRCVGSDSSSWRDATHTLPLRGGRVGLHSGLSHTAPVLSAGGALPAAALWLYASQTPEEKGLNARGPNSHGHAKKLSYEYVRCYLVYILPSFYASLLRSHPKHL
jgi:hypothetical protein